MRKKKIIISIVVVICVLAGIFFIMRFGVLGRIYDTIRCYAVQDKTESEKEGPEELKYETFLDKDGNEIVVEMRKITVFDEEGNEVEMWEDTSEGITIYNNIYEGTLDKIEGNKIYFIVDRIVKGENFDGEDAKGHQIIFDINTYDLEDDPHVGYFVCDSLIVHPEDLWSADEYFYSADELEFLVGKYLRVQDCMAEDSHTGERHKTLVFYLH